MNSKNALGPASLLGFELPHIFLEGKAILKELCKLKIYSVLLFEIMYLPISIPLKNGGDKLEKDQEVIQIHSKQLQKAILNRDAYFSYLSGEKLSNALKFQDEIDAYLKKAGNQNNRLTMIHQLMMDQLKDLQTHSKNLSDNLRDLSSKLKAFQRKKKDGTEV